MKRAIAFFAVLLCFNIASALERVTPEPSAANMVRTDNNFARIDEQYETIEAAVLQLYTAEVTLEASTASKTFSLDGVKSTSTFVAISKTPMTGTITLSITIPSQTVSKPSQAILVPTQTVNITDSSGDTAAVVIPSQYVTSGEQILTVPSQLVSLPGQNAYSPIINVECGANTITITRDLALYSGEIKVSIIGFK